MGILLTERFRGAFAGHPEALAETAKHAETPEFTGHLINALYHDPDLAELSGQYPDRRGDRASATASPTRTAGNRRRTAT